MSKRVEQFSDEIRKVIDYFRVEYNLSYAEAIGVIELAKMWLCLEAFEEDNDDNDDDHVDEDEDGGDDALECTFDPPLEM